MSQKIEQRVWDEFEKEVEKSERKPQSRITNSERPKTSWMRKVCENVRISDLAAEKGVDRCLECGYDLYFDDSRGWFCCTTKKFGGVCDFNGNIVDFVQRVGGL